MSRHIADSRLTTGTRDLTLVNSLRRRAHTLTRSGRSARQSGNHHIDGTRKRHRRIHYNTSPLLLPLPPSETSSSLFTPNHYFHSPNLCTNEQRARPNHILNSLASLSPLRRHRRPSNQFQINAIKVSLVESIGSKYRSAMDILMKTL